VLSGDSLRHVHGAVAIDLDHDDRDVAALHHRLELTRVAPSDATAVKFHRVTQRGRAPRDLRFMPLEASYNGNAHGFPLTSAGIAASWASTASACVQYNGRALARKVLSGAGVARPR
jgi:hypothetical protein